MRLESKLFARSFVLSQCEFGESSSAALYACSQAVSCS
jgi:hypothetical protein